MTFNFKNQYKAVKMGAFGKSTQVDVTANQISETLYSLDNAQANTGISASLSAGSIVLANKDYIGFFRPTVGSDDRFEMSVKINGSTLSTQAISFKEFSAGQVSLNYKTRRQPLMFFYSASEGDVLSVYYQKSTPSSIATIYSYTLVQGNIVHLWEIDK